MKKTIISMSAAALCASAISVQAFAADILSDKSVYANDRESIASAAGTIEQDGKVYVADPNTIMPYYYVSLLDYARTGDFEIIPLAKGIGSKDDRETYLADALDESGNFAGKVIIYKGGSHPGIRVFEPNTDKANSLAFEPNARRINAAVKGRNISLDCKEIKFVFVEGIGNVYYIDTGTKQYLAAVGGNSVNGDLFNRGNGGVVEIGDELKAFADKELAEHEEWLKYLATLPPGENAPTGGNEPPQYMVDNTPYLDDSDNSSTPAGKPDNPYTGSDTSKHTTVLAVELGLISAMIIGGAVVSKKRKNDR